MLAVRVREPHPPVRAHARVAERSAGRDDRLRLPGRHIDAEQLAAAIQRVLQEHGVAAGEPIEHGVIAGKGDVEIVPRVRGEVPDADAFAILRLVDDRQALIARHRGPHRRDHRGAPVTAICDDGACARIDDPQGRVGDVAVLGVL